MVCLDKEKEKLKTKKPENLDSFMPVKKKNWIEFIILKYLIDDNINTNGMFLDYAHDGGMC